ncbi:hypothetical protein D3C87_76490 [compost metagenome]
MKHRKFKRTVRKNIPNFLLKEMFEDPYFNYENCPICDQKLENYSFGFRIHKGCKNDCYHYSLFSLDREHTVFVPSFIEIFGSSFSFFVNAGQSVSYKHYYYDYARFTMLKKRAGNLIKHYKSNERYLMKIMRNGDI